MAALASSKVELYSDLHLKILLRLTPKSLTRFRCVNKIWNSLIVDPKFIAAHLGTSQRHHDFILYNVVAGAFYTRIFDRLQHNACQIQATKSENHYCRLGLSMNPTKHTVFVGHCNGLLCLVKQSFEGCLQDLMLWNPSIGKVKLFPLPKSWTNTSWRVLGFGHDLSRNRYKLVRVPDNDTECIEVLTLGHFWFKPVEIGGLYYSDIHRQKSIFSNGHLYWLAMRFLDSGLKERDLILCFNLAKRTLKGILPPPCEETTEAAEDRFKLRLLHGSVGIMTFKKVNGGILNYIDVWVRMKEKINGSIFHTSWVKQITLPVPELNCRSVWTPFPVCYIKKDKVLVSVDNNKFFSYNIETESYDDEKFEVHGIHIWVDVIPYTESLVSTSLVSP